jgi:hypothetical protein
MMSHLLTGNVKHHTPPVLMIFFAEDEVDVQGFSAVAHNLFTPFRQQAPH